MNDDARRHFEIRHAIISSFRQTLAGEGFIEVETPVLHVEAGGAHARPFVTHHNTLDMQLYLRIALELHLKRLIVGGMERVFEIGRIFRNEGISTRHNPEFTMMELYQAFADWTDVMDITERLITNAARDAIGSTTLSIRGDNVDLADPWPRIRMIDAASEAIGTEIHPSMPRDALADIASKNDVKVAPQWLPGKIIEEIFEAHCESDIVRPTFITGHPVDISPLSRVHIAGGARIINSTIRGPVSVGPDTEIRDAFIGPFSAIGARCSVTSSEVEHSVIMDNSIISDIPRLEGSLIGSHAKVIRTARKPRSLQLMVGDHCQIDVE